MAEQEEKGNSLTFSASLYEQCSKAGKANTICSPYSVSSALSILLPGAAGNTLKELLDVLFPEREKVDAGEAFETAQKTHAAYNKKYGGVVKKGETNTDRTVLNIANRVYIKSDKFETIRRVFLAKIAEMVAPIDCGDPAAAAKLVNGWISDKTNEMITDVLDKGTFADPDFRAVIINAIYFDAAFEVPFKANFTLKEAPFFVDCTRKKKVGRKGCAMMQKKSQKVPYAKVSGYEFVRLGYKKSKIFLVLARPMTPEKGAEIPRLDTVREIKWERTLINLRVPKFKFRFKLKLNAALKAMGMRDAFGGKADFSGMSKEELYIWRVLVTLVFRSDQCMEHCACACNARQCTCGVLQK